MLKKKSLFLFYFFPIITAFAFTAGNYDLKIVSSRDENSLTKKNPKSSCYISKGLICRGGTAPTIALGELWSNPATWGGVKPLAGDIVTIPSNKHIVLDESPPALAGLTIEGKLEFDAKDISLTAGWIMVMGTLEVGKATTPYVHKATITLNATNQSETIMGMGTRGIMVMGGKLELHGVPPTKHYTKLNGHAAAGATTLSLLDPVSWNVNDQIVVSTTDFYGAANGTAQRTQITAINGASLNIQDGLNAHRWGKLQYLTATGMSLTPGTLPLGILTGTPTVLDERAEVANLTRNIVVQSVDDDLWRTNGFGCHIMVMRMNSMVGEARLNGVEIKRGGQAGKLARYPFHWHMLSYEGSTTLPDVTGQYIRNSTINQSAQRGIVIHGTNGAEVKNNVVYDVRGHGVFTEDASERRNIIEGNLVLKVRNPLEVNRLKAHETWRSLGSSGFWVSNPDNTIINNTAADCEGVGLWLAFPERTFGASAAIVLKPRVMKFGAFNNNHAHSNQGAGIFIDLAEVDEEGNTAPSPQYASTTDMQEPNFSNFSNVLMYELGDYSSWKNNQSGIWNRSVLVANRRAVNADNTSSFFSGSTWVGSVIENSLTIGASLNYSMNGVPRPMGYGSEPPAAFATYNSSIDIKNNVAVNFPAVQGSVSGAFATGYYSNPVEKGQIRNTGNITINSHPGVRINPDEPQFTYGIIWDPYNHWKGPTSNSEFSNNYYVFDNTFFTYERTRHIVPNSSAEVSNGVIVEGPFYGFNQFRVNGIERVNDKIDVTRTAVGGAVVGKWVVESPAREGMKLGNMRHFATHPTGYYYLDFPTVNDIHDFTMEVVAMTSTNDYQVLSVEYSGNYTITQLFASTSHNVNDFGITELFPTAYANTRAYTAVSSFQAVVNAPTGEVYWHDKPNNKVWFKVRGGFYAGDPLKAADDNVNLYKAFRIRAYGVLSNLSNNSNEEKGLQVFPNPTSSEVTLMLANINKSNDDILVSNSLGQIVFKGKSGIALGENVLKIDVSGWSDGVYFVKVGRETVKLIKNAN